MILADKIIELRKKNNWSQEDLASQLGVSRQAISKWESAQSIPDLERIIKMSELFDVSTDTLIKDELPLAETPDHPIVETGESLRILTLEEANAFLEAKEKSTRPIAVGVMLCVLALVPIVLSDAFTNEEIAGPVSVMISFLMVLVAVAMFLLNGLPLKEYKWMKEEPFETAYGVTGMVRERQKALQSRLMMHIVVGVSLCILALVVLIASDLPDELIDRPEPLFVAMAFAMAAVAVYLFVSVGLPHGAYQIILQEGDYASRKKGRRAKSRADHWNLLAPGGGRLSWVQPSHHGLGAQLDHLARGRRVVRSTLHRAGVVLHHPRRKAQVSRSL